MYQVCVAVSQYKMHQCFKRSHSLKSLKCSKVPSHRITISISKERKNGISKNNSSKEKLIPNRKNNKFCQDWSCSWEFGWHHLALGLGSMYFLLCSIQHMYSLLHQLHSIPTVFFSRCLTASLKWALHCNPGFTFTAHSWAPCWDSEDAIHCLTSAAFCKLGSNLHDSITPALYMLAKSALHRQWHQGLLPAELKLGPLRLQLQLPLSTCLVKPGETSLHSPVGAGCSRCSLSFTNNFLN